MSPSLITSPLCTLHKWSNVNCSQPPRRRLSHCLVKCLIWNEQAVENIYRLNAIISLGFKRTSCSTILLLFYRYLTMEKPFFFLSWRHFMLQVSATSGNFFSWAWALALLGYIFLENVFKPLICSHEFGSYSWFICRMSCIWNNLSRQI